MGGSPIFGGLIIQKKEFSSVFKYPDMRMERQYQIE
jgi:hypothetical protein